MGEDSEENGRWIPLESNPEVLNGWANKAGLVASQAQFEDVYGLDPDLLGMVMQPCKAVILLFPISKTLEDKRREEEANIAQSGQPDVDPTIFFIKQTISNACGTIGLLHALINSNVTIAPDSPIAKFQEECKDTSPDERAKVLETTPLFADIHAEAASSGQSIVPPDLSTDLHFTCLVAAPSREGGGKRLIELDGRRSGPVDRGECTDLLKDAAKFILDYYIADSSSMHFSLTSLGPPA